VPFLSSDEHERPDASPRGSIAISCHSGAAGVGTTVRGIAVQRHFGVTHEHRQASRRGVLRHVRARLRRHGCCRPGGLARGHRHRSRRRSAGLRPHGRDHGLRGWANLRRPTSTPP